MMLDEFVALGRLDFFETSLAFMAGSGIRVYLIAPSLNQVDKAYGEHNSILDNCHVRVVFSTNDQRTPKRVSGATGVRAEQRPMGHQPGHRSAPRLLPAPARQPGRARPPHTPGEGT